MNKIEEEQKKSIGKETSVLFLVCTFSASVNSRFYFHFLTSCESNGTLPMIV